MTFSTYNDDLRYEMMAEILPGTNENTPDADTVIEDLREILKICYVYTADADTAKELSASDLGKAIVAYLFGSWAGRDSNFEKYAKEYWAPATEATPDGQLDLA